MEKKLRKLQQLLHPPNEKLNNRKKKKLATGAATPPTAASCCYCFGFDVTLNSVTFFVRCHCFASPLFGCPSSSSFSLLLSNSVPSLFFSSLSLSLYFYAWWMRCVSQLLRLINIYGEMDSLTA
jgi:hypothetical protein